MVERSASGSSGSVRTSTYSQLFAVNLRELLNRDGLERVVLVDVHRERVEGDDEFRGVRTVSAACSLTFGGSHLSTRGSQIRGSVDETGNADAGAAARNLYRHGRPYRLVVLRPRLDEIDHGVRTGDAMIPPDWARSACAPEHASDEVRRTAAATRITAE